MTSSHLQIHMCLDVCLFVCSAVLVEEPLKLENCDKFSVCNISKREKNLLNQSSTWSTNPKGIVASVVVSMVLKLSMCFTSDVKLILI